MYYSIYFAVLPFLLLILGLLFTKIRPYFLATGVLLITLFLAFLKGTFFVHPILEGLVTAVVPILWIIFSALFTYYLIQKTGRMKVIEDFLTHITPDSDMQTVIIAFCFGGFLEAVAGFGTSVIIPLAMLAHMKYPKMRAAVLCLVANSVPAAFGALGIPVIVLGDLTSLSVFTLTKYVVIQLFPATLFLPLLLFYIATKSFKKVKAHILELLFVGLLCAVFQLGIGLYIGPELVTLGSSLLTLLCYTLYKNYFKHIEFTKYDELFLSFFPYVILLCLVIITSLIAKDFFSLFSFSLFGVSIAYVQTPGTLLFVSGLLYALFLKIPFSTLFSSSRESVSKISFSAITIIAIVILAKVISYSGLASDVAFLLTTYLGNFYPFFIPFVGALGTFVTGSDTSSNILFGSLQKTVAQNLSLNVEWFTAANTSGATAGKMISPQNISLVSHAQKMEGMERSLVLSTIWYCVLYTVFIGCIVYFGLFLF